MAKRRGGLRSDYKPNESVRLPAIDARAMDIMWPQSTGCGLDPAMRLVAMLLLLWDQETEKGRIEWDHSQIADRTGLSVSQVAGALDRLRQVKLVTETAAGPKLSWWDFDTITKPQWMKEALMRPTRPSGSPPPTRTKDRADEQGDVAAPDAGGAGSPGRRADGADEGAGHAPDAHRQGGG